MNTPSDAMEVENTGGTSLAPIRSAQGLDR
jgi:hypothetical protein